MEMGWCRIGAQWMNDAMLIIDGEAERSLNLMGDEAE